MAKKKGIIMSKKDGGDIPAISSHEEVAAKREDLKGGQI